ncbi:MAG: hypothetical protein ACTS4T_01580 [Candidatus Hodgkinia cicadicola]
MDVNHSALLRKFDWSAAELSTFKRTSAEVSDTLSVVQAACRNLNALSLQTSLADMVTVRMGGRRARTCRSTSRTVTSNRLKSLKLEGDCACLQLKRHFKSGAWCPPKGGSIEAIAWSATPTLSVSMLRGAVVFALRKLEGRSIVNGRTIRRVNYRTSSL